ncbi:tyrosine-type recombinase/integrase [Veillonella sp. R32]|uniref:tyrosine-type recombinase/integrase n=1 Tax=Veillonella sp. R32 TaxID=2021312 RepID=UPI00138945BB|nr:tyrosine-type recombinase/integrase [Veillonella sp. R32]KAF1680739.1 hypothetical protein VER_08195 [Veillonella sp. R32]
MIKQKENLGIANVANYNMTKSRCTHLLKVPIQKIRLAQLQDIVDNCGLSAANKRQIKVTLNAVFTVAYENDYIQKNYAELIKLPALGKSDKHKPYSLDDLQTLWAHQDDEIIEIYGLEEHKPHDGRHTFITFTSNYGIDEILVKLIVGHSNSRNITQDVYTHKTQSQLLEAVNLLPYGTNMTQLSKKLVGAIEA